MTPVTNMILTVQRLMGELIVLKIRIRRAIIRELKTGRTIIRLMFTRTP